MANHGCVNGSLEDADYSSPVPVIGLYIAGASFLCMLIMLYDIIAGFRARKRWLPCKYFTLNSVSLTLLGVATKLTVDLTTAMPTPQDQLSKLSATTLICISMGFLLPAIGNTNESECLTNMVALTIFVITVIVNICIQISTSVIVLFVVEHIIVMGFMLLLLGILWYSSWDSNNRKKVPFKSMKQMVRNLREASMYRRIRICYRDSFATNPQLSSSSHPNNYSAGGICLFSSVILIQAAVRSLILKRITFCSGSSDYQWSMGIIVATQILTVIVGCFGTSFRWLAMVNHTNFKLLTESREEDDLDVMEKHPLLKPVLNFDKSRRLLVYICFLTLLMVQLPFKYPLLLLQFVLNCFCHQEKTEDDLTLSEPSQWAKRKSSEDMERLIEVSHRKPWIHVYQLLSQTPPSQPQPPKELADPTGEEVFPLTISCLSITIFVRLYQVLLPVNLHGSLDHALIEANQVIRFIAKTLCPAGRDDKNLLYQEAVWRGPGFGSYVSKILSEVPASDQLLLSDVDRANLIIQSLPPFFSQSGIHVNYVVRKFLILFSRHGRFLTVDELYAFILHMYIDMLHALLAEFPTAIFKSLHESPDEELEERVKLAMKYFCQVQPLEGGIQWFFPSEWDVQRFLTPEEAGVAHSNAAAATKDTVGDSVDANNSVQGTSCDVIINVP